MHKMRYAFTMIELIFIIVIIGILASVAVPKLALSRVDASVASCVHQYNQLQREIYQSFLVSDFEDWRTKKISEVTNISTRSINKIGIESAPATLIHDTWITFRCGGERVGWMSTRFNKSSWSPDSTEYQLVTVIQQENRLTSPEGKKFYDIMTKQFGNSRVKKIALNSYY